MSAMPMPDDSNEYEDALSGKRILYMPSCVIIEMMAKLHSRILAVKLAGVTNRDVPEIVALLRRMTTNLRVTADAYSGSHIRLFVGDWRKDKQRAKKMFFTIADRLGYIAAMVGHAEQEMLRRAVELMAVEWIRLDSVMDAKAAAAKKSGDTVCRYFRNNQPENWKPRMANILRTLHEEAERGGGDYLVLLCFGQIRQMLLAAIDDLEQQELRQYGRLTIKKFDPDSVLAVSQEDVPFTCQNCLELTDSIGGQAADAEYPALAFAEAILTVRGSSCPIGRLNQIDKKDMLPDSGRKTPEPPKRKRHATTQWLRSVLSRITKIYKKSVTRT